MPKLGNIVQSLVDLLRLSVKKELTVIAGMDEEITVFNKNSGKKIESSKDIEDLSHQDVLVITLNGEDVRLKKISRVHYDSEVTIWDICGEGENNKRIFLSLYLKTK